LTAVLAAASMGEAPPAAAGNRTGRSAGPTDHRPPPDVPTDPNPPWRLGSRRGGGPAMRAWNEREPVSQRSGMPIGPNAAGGAAARAPPAEAPPLAGSGRDGEMSTWWN
jgi:hypothetical protein